MGKYTTNFDLIMRNAAYLAAIAVLGVTKLMGGTWTAFLIGIALTDLSYRALLWDFSRYGVLDWRSIRRQIQSLSLPVRFILALLFVGFDVWADIYTGDYELGREFNLYLIPIFFSSLLFGTRVTAATCVLCWLAVCYYDIEPRYSFAIESITDALIFVLLSAVVFLIPQLLIASAELTVDKRSWP